MRLSIGADGLAEIVFDDPDRSANVLTEAVMRRLEELLREVQTAAETGRARALLLTSGKEGSFIVGADIEAIAEVENPEVAAEGSRFGQRVFAALERLPIPTLAAIRGACMGGGLELALACRYRLAASDSATRLALPEVLLGILPAWGGTTRLPERVGLTAALDLLLTGKTIDGRRAARIGLVDELLPVEGFDRAARRALGAAARGEFRPKPIRKPPVARILEGNPLGRWILLRTAERRVRTESGGHYPAPLRILDLLRAAPGVPRERAFALEAEAAGELVTSEVSQNLVHLFRLREGARRRGEGAGSSPPLSAIGVVGAGIMGGGIAQVAADRGLRVRLRDLRPEAVSQALRHANELFRKSVERRRTSARQSEEAMARIAGGVDAKGFRALDLVVEAVVEKLEVKRALFRELEDTVTEACVLATNTSSLSIDRIAEGLRRPERFLGVHFFNPVHRMLLVEVVRGAATGDPAVARARAFALHLGKTPVVVRDGPGFLVNRILSPYLNEAGHLLAEGSSIEAIDGAARRFGMPMGPLRLIDEIGIDITSHAGESLHAALGDRLTPAKPLLALARSGQLGRKGGSGFYRYREGRELGPDPEVYDRIGLSPPTGTGGPNPEEIRDRMVLAMVNEAARVLQDRITDSAGDLDLAMILGTGFPPFLGGPLRLADRRHLRAIVALLRGYEERGASRFAPAPLLLRLAEEDRGFYDAFPARY